MEQRILLVDDETGILDMLETILNKEGFRSIERAETGQRALQLVEEFEPQLIVLDVMLPDMSGLELCMELRKKTEAPVLFLTARTSDYDKLVGFAMGGDDYITKPFNALEVVARIKVQLKRWQMCLSQGRPKTLEFADFGINTESCEVIRNGQPLEMTALEYSLLLFFAEHPNRIFTAAQLYENVWGQLNMGDDKTVVMHISKIRKKIEPDAQVPKYIKNIRGLGYKFIPHKQGETRQ
ncbi:MAG: response regulator transcription factor [Paenibacillus macerans]|nr:response regulator transcription factor [Paenibacillus macerans]MDU7476303.1 response regulator transcription factor [Paenibacillus macerans]MEC0151890.1 response regulator transcription factor [Paenibacillus macerans]MEC0333974.1 response regulator transcription factor [Paenibacillus macerans]SUD26580.1 alkaline phosphatase synthesis transcriptional regulatory proteinphop [Paenibacillus macerans]